MDEEQLYLEEAKQIWRNFVPRAGQADTVQGELLRAVEKLRDEAVRNGNMNWDDGFEIFISYLNSKLLDPVVYSPSILSATREMLSRLNDYDHPTTDESLYDRLCDRVVDYWRHYGSLPNTRNPRLRR